MVRCYDVAISRHRYADLATFVRETMKDKGLDPPTVARKSGGTISPAYVRQIVNRVQINVSVSMLFGLSRGLTVPIKDVMRAAAGGWAEDDKDFLQGRLYLIHKKLADAPDDVKRSVDFVIDATLRELDHQEESRPRRKPQLRKRR
jgi:hypothetical protein